MMTPEELKVAAANMPVVPYEKEMLDNSALGADLLGHIVRAGLFDEKHPQMPPAEVFEWYVMDVTFRFIGEEHIYIHLLGRDPAQADGLKAALTELVMVIDIIARNKQFGLQGKVGEVLRIRRLKLPENFDHTYGQVLKL
jgi:hypothetical protein